LGILIVDEFPNDCSRSIGAPEPGHRATRGLI